MLLSGLGTVFNLCTGGIPEYMKWLTENFFDKMYSNFIKFFLNIISDLPEVISFIPIEITTNLNFWFFSSKSKSINWLEFTPDFAITFHLHLKFNLRLFIRLPDRDWSICSTPTPEADESPIHKILMICPFPITPDLLPVASGSFNTFFLTFFPCNFKKGRKKNCMI